MKRLYKQLLLFTLLMPGLAAFADDNERSKTIRQQLTVPKEVSLEMINKYGDIIIHTWEYDSISVEVTITAHGKKDEVLERQLDRVFVEISQVGKYVRMASVLDRKSGSLNEFFKSIGDQSKALLSKNKIEINWVVYMPDHTEVMIENKFGDIYMDAVYGKAKLEMSHGKLRSDGFYGYSRLELSYADADIDYLKEAYLDLKVSEIDIAKADFLTISGSSSEYYLKEVKSLKIDSRNDDISVNSLNSLSGSASFSNIKIESLRQSVDADLKYGEFELQFVQKGFSKISLKTQSTDIELGVDETAGFIFDITAKEEQLRIPPAINEDSREYIDDKQKYINSRGKVGLYQSSPSRLLIDAQGGSVELSVSVLKSSSASH